MEIVTRVETKLTHYLQLNNSSEISTTIPRYTTWIVKMWHFGFDVMDRYEGEGFHTTFEESVSDLWLIYTKKMNANNLRLRIEHQEYPNKSITESLLEAIKKSGKSASFRSADEVYHTRNTESK